VLHQKPASPQDLPGFRSHPGLSTFLFTAAACRRPLLDVVGARWCGPCRRMHSETFPIPAVAARVNSQFIPVLIDADEQPEAVRSLGVDSFPTVLVVSPGQKVLGRLTGFQSAAQRSARLASYQPARQPLLRYRAVPERPAPFHQAHDHSTEYRPVRPSPENKPWAQRMWDAIRARDARPRTTLEAAIAFSTGHWERCQPSRVPSHYWHITDRGGRRKSPRRCRSCPF
jgi:thiol-disulfide isomerase/thioredoxin